MASNEIIPSSVLVTGAGGYIGFAVATAFRQAGYFVYGLVRSEKHSALLRAHEIIPVVKDAYKVDEYRKYIEACPVIVDCTSTMGEKEHPETYPLNLLKVVEEASKKRDLLLPPKTFVYTSGIMVYGSDPRVRDEAWPIGTKFYANWRRQVETAIAQSPHIAGIVIRPAWVFGGSGGPTADLMFSNPAKLVLRGKVHNRRYSWVHIDDLKESYVAAVNKASAAKGLIFNICNGYDNPVYADLVLQGCRLAGYKGELHWEDNKEWQDEAVDDDVVLQSLQATTIFGWTPKLFGLLDNLSFYYEAHKAATTLHKRS